MFIDHARVHLQAGDGGRGCLSFRREKFVPLGGPDGGDGGHGGDIVLRADAALTTLLDFRYRSHLRAPSGGDGRGRNQHGASGDHLVLRVPPGTEVRDADTGELLADLTAAGQRMTVARGGRGGRGNARFATSTRQAPRFAERGEPGEQRTVDLDLKLIADVGLVGAPNAGKSTLLRAISSARPRVAPYPFTTLTPQPGVVRHRGSEFVVVDIPGLAEGASQGVGLGHEFLRHVERTRYLVQVVDAAGIDGRSPAADVEAIETELRLFRPKLAERPRLVAANKCDLAEARENLPALREAAEARGLRLLPVSAATGEGVEALLDEVVRQLAALGPREAAEAVPAAEPVVFRASAAADAEARDEGAIVVQRDPDGGFAVRGRGLERLVGMADLENPEAIGYLRQRLDRMGVSAALRRAGARDGDEVRIGAWTLAFEVRSRTRRSGGCHDETCPVEVLADGRRPKGG
jgi:GTP-binding protein